MNIFQNKTIKLGGEEIKKLEYENASLKVEIKCLKLEIERLKEMVERKEKKIERLQIKNVFPNFSVGAKSSNDY